MVKNSATTSEKSCKESTSNTVSPTNETVAVAPTELKG